LPVVGAECHTAPQDQTPAQAYGQMQVRERLRDFGTVTGRTLLAEKLPQE